jgi:hypothetical protein
MSDDPRWGNDSRERDDDTRDREPIEPRDVFLEKLDLPRGLDREVVRDRDHEYTLRGSESRTLSLVGSFRVPSHGVTRDGQLARNRFRAPPALRQAADRGDHLAFDHRYLHQRRYQTPSLLLHVTSLRGVRITVARGSISLSLYSLKNRRLGNAKC